MIRKISTSTYIRVVNIEFFSVQDPIWNNEEGLWVVLQPSTWRVVKMILPSLLESSLTIHLSTYNFRSMESFPSTRGTTHISTREQKKGYWLGSYWECLSRSIFAVESLWFSFQFNPAPLTFGHLYFTVSTMFTFSCKRCVKLPLEKAPQLPTLLLHKKKALEMRH